jgi:hypothetical protein
VDEDIIVEGDGSYEEMHTHVQRVVAEHGWTNHAHVSYGFEYGPSKGQSGPYRARITSPPDDETMVRST